MTKYQLYTDGGAKPNPGLAGWGCGLWLCDPDGLSVQQTSATLIRARCHGELRATNCKMELMGALEGFKMLRAAAVKGDEADIFFDATYVLNSIGKGKFTGRFTGYMAEWERSGWKDRPNLPLILAIRDEVLALHRQGVLMTFHWVGSHDKRGLRQTDPASDPMKNEYADRLAEKGKTKAKA